MHTDGFGEVTDSELTPLPGMGNWADESPRVSRTQSRSANYAGDDEPTKQLHRAHILPALTRATSIPPLPNLAPAADDEPTTDYTAPAMSFLSRAQPDRLRAGAPSPFPAPRDASHGTRDVTPSVARGRRDPAAARVPPNGPKPGRTTGVVLPAGVSSSSLSARLQGSKRLNVAPPSAASEAARPNLRRTAPLSPPLSAAIRIANEARMRESLDELERAASRGPAPAAVPAPVAARPVLPSLPVIAPRARSAALPPLTRNFESTPPAAAAMTEPDPNTPPTEECVPAETWTVQSVQSEVVEARFDIEPAAPGHLARVFTQIRSLRFSFRRGAGAALVASESVPAVQPVAASTGIVRPPDRRWIVVAAAAVFGLCAACTAAWVLTRPPQAAVAMETGPTDAEVARILQARTGFIVSTYPSGARIHVDGRETGRFSPERVTGLTPGLHSIELKLAGYYDTNLPAVLEEGSTLVLPPVELRPLPPNAGPSDDPGH